MKTQRLLFSAFAVSLLLFSCAPVLNKTYMKEGDREVSFQALREHPDDYKGKIFVFGGVIVRTRLTKEGSEVEAMQVPVDRYGYFRDRGRSEGRFLGIVPGSEQMLDPEVFSRGRRITVAAQFVGLRKDRIEEMEYVYPVFQLLQIHLWHREHYYYPAYYYDPWFYPYPYFYWDAWWVYPYSYHYDYYNRGGPPPAYRRTLPNQPPPSREPMPMSPERVPERGGAAPRR